MVMKPGAILQRLEEIEARAKRATPGPWKWDEIPEDGAGRYWGLWSQNRWLSDPEVLGPYPEDEDCLSVEVRQADARDQSGWKQWPKLRRKYANRRNGI